MRTFYSMVDSTLGTPQPEQLSLCRSKAQKEDGEIVFYGAEEIMCIQSQPFIISKLKKTPGITDVVFFAFAQFCYGEKFNFKLLKEIVQDGIGVHFAREDMSFMTVDDIERDFLLLSAYFHSFQRRLNRGSQLIT